jgi:sulfide:quinone oxidoreductase
MAESGCVRVVVAGGGVAALEATLALRALAGERVVVEVVAPEQEFVYRPLAVAEPFRVDQVRRLPLRRLVEAAGAQLRPGFVHGVDPGRNTIFVDHGPELEYDYLLLTVGAVAHEAVRGALTFAGPADVPALAGLLERAVTGEVASIAFVVPARTSWPLPVYELTLLTWSYLRDRYTTGCELVLATAEDAPLGLFGLAASEAIRTVLSIRGIGLCLRAAAFAFEDGLLQFTSRDPLAVSAVVAAPRLEGPRLAGIPSDRDGFVPVDDDGRVRALGNVYAAGDLTTYPLKQGGIASQQADTAAASIAADAGATIEPIPFKPVLRGLLLTGLFPRYLTTTLETAESEISTEPLWWPPAKIAGRYLTPFLARFGLPTSEPTHDTLDIPVELTLPSTRRNRAPARTPAHTT